MTLRWARPVSALLLAVVAVLLVPTASSAQESAQESTQEEASATTVSGTIRAGSETLPGVEILVQQGGADIGSATTDDDGRWSVEVPEPGAYTVQVVVETIPEGFSLRDEESFRVQEVDIEEGANSVLFPFVAGEAGGAPGGRSTLSRLANLTFSGIQLGAIIAITSLGLSLIFGVTGLINFAHGEMVAVGAIAAWFMNSPGGLLNIHLIFAAILAVLLGGLFGYGMERGMFRPLRARNTGLISLLVITIGLSILVRYFLLAVYGGQANPYRDYAAQSGISLGPIATTPKSFAVTVLSLIVLGAVGLLLTRTKLGTAIRAVADNRDLAESSGIDVERIILAVWVAGGGLAALGGVFQGMTQSVTWDMGFKLLLLMFAGVILGGLGTAFGAMVGGLVVGIAVQVSTLWFSVELKTAFAFGLLIVVLLFRPQGILGQRERIG